MPRWQTPTSAKPPLWKDALRNYDFAADITGSQANRNFSQRNGLAVGKLSGSSKPEDYSGVGLVTDRWGNQIWITEERGGKFALFDKYKLWGRRDPYMMPVPRFLGSGESGRNAILILDCPAIGSKSTSCQNYPGNETAWSILKHKGDPYTKSGKTGYLGFWDEYKYKCEYSNVVGALMGVDQLCQRIGKALDRPVVILLVGEPYKFSDAVSSIADVLGLVSSVVLPFVGSLPIEGLKALTVNASKVIATLSASANFLASGGTVTVANFRQYLLPTVDLMTPDSWRGTISQAASVYESAARGDYPTLAQELGVSTSLIQSVGISDPLAVVKITESSIKGDVGGILQNFQSLQMVDRVSKWAGGIQAMKGKLLDSDSRISNVPFLQDLLQQAAGGAAVQMVANVQAVAQLALHDAADPELVDGGVPLWSQLALAVSGWPVPGEVFDSLAYASLRSQVQEAKAIARKIGVTMKSFHIPVTVPASKRAMFAEYLREDEGINVEGGSIFTRYAEWY